MFSPALSVLCRPLLLSTLRQQCVSPSGLSCCGQRPLLGYRFFSASSAVLFSSVVSLHRLSASSLPKSFLTGGPRAASRWCACSQQFRWCSVLSPHMHLLLNHETPNQS